MAETSSRSGKVALVTGCSRGIGHAAALRLAAEGWTVVATLRGEEGREALLAAGVVPMRADVTDIAEVDAVVADTVARFGRIDALIANAGQGLFGCFEDVSDAAAEALFDVNVHGVLRVARAALPHLRELSRILFAGSDVLLLDEPTNHLDVDAKTWLLGFMRNYRGALLVISSIAGRRSAPGSSLYNASKFALEGWGEALAFELAPFGVRVVLIEPGPTASGFAANAGQGEGVGAGPYAGITARLRALRAETFSSNAPVETVTDAIIAALNQQDPPLRWPTGRGTAAQILAARLLPWKRKIKLPRP